MDAITGGQYPGALGESVNSTWPIPVSIGSWGGVPFVCSHLGLRAGSQGRCLGANFKEPNSFSGLLWSKCSNLFCKLGLFSR